MTEPAATVTVPLARRRLDRLWIPILVMHGLLIVVIVVAAVWVISALDAGFAAFPFVIILAGEVVQVAFAWSTYSGMRRVGVPLGLSPDRLTLRSPYGEVSAPWTAVQSVAIERHLFGSRLRVRLAPPGHPGRDEVRSSLAGRAARIERRDGLRFSLRILDIDPARLRTLFAEQSGGRVVVG